MPERILDSTGSLISEKPQVLRVWQEHFDNLLNKEQVVSGAIPHSLSFEIVFSDYPISIDEIESVILVIKNYWT